MLPPLPKAASLHCAPPLVLLLPLLIIIAQSLSSSNQWAYRKGYSTELLLVMTEDWRRALDKNLVVGIVFLDFRKAFDSISHSLLLRKLQGLGIAGDLWSWIKDYLSNRTQVTITNGSQSEGL